jgi:uncharacterized membrane protein HdeD (DUF308 family)
MSQVPNDIAQRMQAQFAAAVQQHSTLFLVEGIVLVVLGLLAILLPQIATLAIELLLGWLFLISGILGLVTTFWTKPAPGFWWALISAILAIVAGVLLLAWPLTGVLSLTIVLVAFFLAEGVVTIMYAVEHRRELNGRWGWMLASGIITLLLAFLIWARFPSTAAWAIGLLAGIDLVFGGSALIGMAVAAKKGSGTATTAGQTPPPPASLPPAKA